MGTLAPKYAPARSEDCCYAFSITAPGAGFVVFAYGDTKLIPQLAVFSWPAGAPRGKAGHAGPAACTGHVK